MRKAATDGSGRRGPDQVASFLEAMLDRHGVAERQRIRALEAALGLSYAQARRRMLGTSPWSIEELKRLADHFHEPLIPLVAAYLHQPGKAATFRIGSAVLACTVWPAGKPLSNRVGPLVVLHDKATDQWTVVPAPEAAERATYELSMLLFERPTARRVAVLDDNRRAADAIVEWLAGTGISATPFGTGLDLQAAIQTAEFDGYIVEWLPDAAAAHAVLSAIRARSPTRPLIILTGRIGTAGGVTEGELASAGTTYKALVFEKPMRHLTILNALELGFGGPTKP